MKHYLCAILLLFVFSSTLFGNETWESYQKNIVDTVTALAIEGDIIWIGTYNGLAKYNKITGESIPFTEEDGLVDNEINDIAVDQNGEKWIATNNGISSFDGISWTSYGNEIFANTTILAIAVDQDNTKWFITNDSVIRFDDNESWQVYTADNGIPVDALTTIAIDKTNSVWIGTSLRGILSFNGIEWTLYDEYKPKVVSITVDDENTLWFGDYKGSVISYNGNEWSKIQVISTPWFLFSCAVDKNNVLWCGTQQGLYRIENGTKRIFVDNDGLEKSKCRLIKIDQYNDLWIAGYYGLTKFNGSLFTNHLGFTGPLDTTIHSIAIDHDNVKWFGHKSEDVSHYNDIKWSKLTTDGYTYVGENIVVDSNNIKWFTAGEQGVLIYDNMKVQEFFGKQLGIHVTSLFAEKNNYIWISTISTWIPERFGGVGRFFIDIPTNSYLDVGFVNNGNEKIYFTEDSQRNIWMNGIDSNYYLYENKVEIPLLNYYNGQDLIDVESAKYLLYDIEIDKNDILWGASVDRLMRFDGLKWDYFTTLNSGLTNDIIHVIVVDHNNTKWIGTEAGVCRFDDNTWTTFNRLNSG
ncbi:MAG: hypothetical protein JXB48_17160, partial [Candidatus Latescibacteria bacterium]|nr:hypothetical protein [Candidatus Latescibacterota bacterium]